VACLFADRDGEKIGRGSGNGFGAENLNHPSGAPQQV
jgi:hypothetical protein